MARQTHGIPIVLTLEGNSGRDTEVGCGIFGTEPAEVILKWRDAWRLALPTPADDEWLEQRLAFGTRIEKACTFGGTEPLMTIPHIKIGPKGIEMQRDLTGSMRTIHHGENSSGPRSLADFRERKDQCSGRGDVADKDHFGAWSYASPEVFDHLFIARQR